MRLLRITYADRRAGNADEGIHILEDDAEKAEEGSNRCAVGLLNGVAALQRSCVALAVGGDGSRGGDRKDGERRNGEDFGEHCKSV